ncbi:MAG: STAS/SEC14 domain-containing protein [Blastocatellia bacterium]
MPTIQIETDQLLQAALQMPRKEMEQFVARLFTLKAREETPGLPEREAELLTQINQGLPPATARRMKKLIAKRDSRDITEDELQELIGITDEAERLNVERVKHLIELAALRNVTLDELMDQLGLNSRPYD